MLNAECYKIEAMAPEQSSEPTAALAAHSMSIGQILAQSFRLYATRFVPFLAISFTLCVPFGLAVGIAGLDVAGVPPPETEGLLGTLRALVPRAAGLLGIALAFWALVFPLAKAVLSIQIVAAAEGKPTSGVESLRRSLPRLPGVLAAHLLAQVAVGAGLLLLVVPGIFLGLWFILVPETVALEGGGIFEAFRKSLRRVRREMRKTALLPRGGPHLRSRREPPGAPPARRAPGLPRGLLGHRHRRPRPPHPGGPLHPPLLGAAGEGGGRRGRDGRNRLNFGLPGAS
jgi:hypothetical protein